ncbi:MAG: acetoacetate decarboxylase family protein [Actinomycetota bacterium]|nr:acetoacetate decarboxylase family protein [Actinomycetota bacterium]
MTVPGPPWSLSGKCMAAFVHTHHREPLPIGAPLPGPSLVVAARYDTSPVGAYLELAVGRPARIGPWPGLCVTTMVVDSAESRSGGRLYWGFPKELSALRWTKDPGGASLRWEGRDLQVRGHPHGPAMPVAVPLCCVQDRDGPVAILGRLRGRMRAAIIEIEAPATDALEGLAGEHRGLMVTGLRLVMGRARPRGGAVRP